MIRFFKLFLSFCFFSNISFAQDLFNLDNTLKFAEYLKNKGDNLFALEEYNRAYFLSPKNTQIHLEILSLNRKLGYFSQSLDFIDKIETSQIINKEKLFCFLKLSKFESIDFELKNKSLILDKNDMHIFKVSRLILDDKWSEARKYISELKPSDKSIYIKKTTSTIKKHEMIKFKNPYLASSMSLIIPGSGKLYLGDNKDALFSFLTITLAGWQAYDSFNRSGKNSISGWIYGGFTLLLYSGNIYGSFDAAKKYNYNRQLLIDEEINYNIDNYIY